MLKNVVFQTFISSRFSKSTLKVIAVIAVLVFTNCSTANEDEKPNATDPVEEKQTNAKYSVTFEINWNKNDFPVDYPSGAHFSSIVGWSHKTTSTFMKVGTFASKGIKDVAETGSTVEIKKEIEEKISNKEGKKFFKGSGLGSGVGKIEIEIEVDTDYPSISLITMIAPSPDWYVGIVNINLYANEKFISERTLDGLVYDAGTDDGLTFRAANKETDPQQKIFLLTAPPLGDGKTVAKKFCTVKIKKL